MNPRHLALIVLPLGALAGIGSCGTDTPHDEGNTFPLIGLHQALPCDSCHLDGFGPLDTRCQSCHEDDRPLDHYPGDCGGCHTELGWGVFTTTTGVDNHDFLPLVDSHDLDCSSCHTPGDYGGLDAACTSCHEPERPPYHYVGDCAPCHTPTVWSDGRVHPVDLPHHDANCGSCHPAPADRLQFSCIDGCHDDETTAPLHGNVPGYQWVSTECFSCHF